MVYLLNLVPDIDLDGKGREEEMVGVWREDNISRIQCMKKIYFSIKRKKNQCRIGRYRTVSFKTLMFFMTD